MTSAGWVGQYWEPHGRSPRRSQRRSTWCPWNYDSPRVHNLLHVITPHCKGTYIKKSFQQNTTNIHEPSPGMNFLAQISCIRIKRERKRKQKKRVANIKEPFHVHVKWLFPNPIFFPGAQLAFNFHIWFASSVSCSVLWLRLLYLLQEHEIRYDNNPGGGGVVGGGGGEDRTIFRIGSGSSETGLLMSNYGEEQTSREEFM